MSSRGISTVEGLDKRGLDNKFPIKARGRGFHLWAFLLSRLVGACLGGLFDFGCIHKRGNSGKSQTRLQACCTCRYFLGNFLEKRMSRELNILIGCQGIRDVRIGTHCHK
jgi:hypothetical protein